MKHQEGCLELTILMGTYFLLTRLLKHKAVHHLYGCILLDLDIRLNACAFDQIILRRKPVGNTQAQHGTVA